MTAAVCLKCGEFKLGAFSRCAKCGYVPEDDESLTKHLLVTDHYHTHEALEAIGERIKSGLPINFDPELLAAARVSKTQLDADMKQPGYGFMTCLILLGVVMVGVGAVVIGAGVAFFKMMVSFFAK